MSSLLVINLLIFSKIDDEQFKKILSFIESGKQDSATLECGGGRQGTEGYFIQPTVCSNATEKMKIGREEVNKKIYIVKFSYLLVLDLDKKTV